MPEWITADKLRVLQWLCAELDHTLASWMAVGGLAGNLWGSAWPLHDLDIEVPTSDLPLLAARWPQLTTSYGRYIDEEFDIELLRLRVDGVEIDIAGADDAWGFTPGGVRIRFPNTLSQCVLRPLSGRLIPCQQLEDLIAYKRLIGRHQDVLDLTTL